MLSAGIDMSLCLSLGGVESGALQNYVNTDLSPGKLSSVSLCINLNLFSVNSDGILTVGNLVSQFISALSRIILQQVSKHLGRGKIVDCNDFKSFCAEHLSESKTSNTAKTINCYFDCHF